MTGVVLGIRFHSVVGTNPFTTHGNIRVDIRKGPFGLNALQVGDFQAAASRNNVASITNTPATENWFIAKLSTTSYAFINPKGLTQFRLQFVTGDNDDSGADKFRFYSGENAYLSNRPLLMILYYIP